MSNLTRRQAIDRGHRRARLMLLAVVAAWSIALIVSHRRGPNLTLILLISAFTVANLLLYIRGAFLSYRLLNDIAAGSHCINCGYDLWGSLRAGSHNCPECDRPIPEGTHERLLPPGLVPADTAVAPQAPAEDGHANREHP